MKSRQQVHNVHLRGLVWKSLYYFVLTGEGRFRDFVAAISIARLIFDAIDKILIHWDTESDTLNVWFDDPQLEHSYEETGDEVILSKDATGRIIGFEKLNYRAATFPLLPSSRE